MTSTSTIKNIPEILHFHGYTKRPVDYFNRPIRKVDIYIPFANIMRITKHKTRFHKYNFFYYCILLSDGSNIYINHTIYRTDGMGEFMVENYDYLYLERLLCPTRASV